MTQQNVIRYTTKNCSQYATESLDTQQNLHAGTSGSTESLAGSHYIDQFTTTHEISWLECELVRIYCGLILYWRECSVVFAVTLSRHVLSISQPAERKRMILDLVVLVPVVLPIVIPSREDRTMRETIVPVVPTRKERLFPALRRWHIL